MTRPARGGAYCSPEGSTAPSSTGRNLVCALSPGGRNRWRAADQNTGAAESGTAPGSRRALLAALRKAGIPLPKRGLPEDELRALLDAGPTPSVVDDSMEAGIVVPETPVLNDPTPPEPPAPAEPAPPVGLPVGEPIAPSENLWGAASAQHALAAGKVCAHWDGAIMRTADAMDPSTDRIRVDGQSLRNHLRILATKGHGNMVSAQDQVAEVRRLASLVDSPVHQRTLQMLADDLDAPPLDSIPSSGLPADFPPPLRRLADKLGEIPLARRSGDLLELEALWAMGSKWSRGRLRGRSLETAVRNGVLNRRHESREGKSQIDALALEAIRALEVSRPSWS